MKRKDAERKSSDRERTRRMEKGNEKLNNDSQRKLYRLKDTSGLFHTENNSEQPILIETSDELLVR